MCLIIFLVFLSRTTYRRALKSLSIKASSTSKYISKQYIVHIVWSGTLSSLWMCIIWHSKPWDLYAQWRTKSRTHILKYIIMTHFTGSRNMANAFPIGKRFYVTCAEECMPSVPAVSSCMCAVIQKTPPQPLSVSSLHPALGVAQPEHLGLCC